MKLNTLFQSPSKHKKCAWSSLNSAFVFHMAMIVWLPSGLMPHRGKVTAEQWDMAAIVLLVSKTGKRFIKLDNLHEGKKKGATSCN